MNVLGKIPATASLSSSQFENRTNGELLKAADWAVIAVHLVLTIAVGVSVALTNKSKDKMLAGRSMNGFVIGLSMLSGLCSGISYIGVPGYAVGDGVGSMFLWLGDFIALPVGAIIIIPFFHRLQLTTAYEYMSLRFAKNVRIIGTCLFITRIVLYLGVVLYAPGIILETATGIPLWGNILFMGVVATIWTLKGGMVAVIYTDAVQSCAMLIGAVVCISLTITMVPGGIGGIFSAMANHTTNTTDYLPWNALIAFHPTQARDPGESFWAFFIGVAFNTLVQTTTDQLAVQRFMTAKNLVECIKSFILSGLLSALIIVLLAFEGVCILGYWLTHGNSLTPLENHNVTTSDHNLPFFALTVLPGGVAGLLLAAVVGSTMSVYSGGINAAATAFQVDIMTYLCHMSTGERGSVAEQRRLSILTLCFSWFVAVFCLRSPCRVFAGVKH